MILNLKFIFNEVSMIITFTDLYESGTADESGTIFIKCELRIRNKFATSQVGDYFYLSLSCLVSTKRSHMLKQTCS